MAPLPPPSQWQKGSHPDYTAFVIEVFVCRDQEGNVHSARRLQDEQDEQTIQHLGDSQGMEEGAFGLLIEAARQEALLQTLIQVSQDESFKRRLLDNDPSDDLRAKVLEDVVKVVSMTLSHVGTSIVQETLDYVRNGLREQT